MTGYSCEGICRDEVSPSAASCSLTIRIVKEQEAALGDTSSRHIPSQEYPVMRGRVGGANRDRTDDLLDANQTLSQLSYGPVYRGQSWWVWLDSN